MHNSTINIWGTLRNIVLYCIYNQWPITHMCGRTIRSVRSQYCPQ